MKRYYLSSLLITILIAVLTTGCGTATSTEATPPPTATNFPTLPASTEMAIPETATSAPKEAEPVGQTENLPHWLRNVDQEETATVGGDDDTPPWLHRERWEAAEEEPQAPLPTSPSDWHPIEPQ